MKRMIIGLVGHPSSGKDTVAKYLVDKYGFTHVSTSDLLREYVRKEGLGEPTRELLNKVGTFVREKNGADYLVSLGLQNNAPRIVISGIRSLSEGNKIKSSGGYIFALYAPIELRYELSRGRGRVGDGTFEEFKTIEEKESRNTDPNAQNVEGVMALADFTADNISGLDTLYKQIDLIIEGILRTTS